MYLKIMSDEDRPDNHYAKSYRIVECKTVTFEHGHGKSYALVDGMNYEIPGNAYLMNAAGKTFDSFTHSNGAILPAGEQVIPAT